MVKKTMIFLLAGAAIFTACKKNDSTARTTAQKVVGKWTYVSDIGTYIHLGVSHPNSYIGIAGDFIDFRSDGTLYDHYNGGSDTTSYTILSDALIKIDSDTLQIKTLTDNSLVLYQGITARDSSQSTITLKK